MKFSHKKHHPHRLWYWIEIPGYLWIHGKGWMPESNMTEADWNKSGSYPHKVKYIKDALNPYKYPDGIKAEVERWYYIHGKRRQILWVLIGKMKPEQEESQDAK